jgi:hypothetical protein
MEEYDTSTLILGALVLALVVVLVLLVVSGGERRVENDLEAPRSKKLSRSGTFAIGLMFVFGFHLLIRWCLETSDLLIYDDVLNILVFLLVFVLVIVPGLRYVASPTDKDDKGKPQTAGYVGVIFVFGSPIPFKALQYVTPSGWVWIPWFFLGDVQAAPSNTKEYGYDVPKTSGETPFNVASLGRIVNIAVDGTRTVMLDGVKFVIMAARLRIRFVVVDPYLWIEQDAKVVERTMVSETVEKVRQTAANGEYQDRRGRQLKILDDIDLMQKKAKLGKRITKDARPDALKAFGVYVKEIQIPHLTPADPKVVEQYQKAAIEVQQRTAQTVEFEHYLSMADKAVAAAQLRGLELKFEHALQLAYVNEGKIQWDKSTFGGGGRGVAVVNTGGQTQGHHGAQGAAAAGTVPAPAAPTPSPDATTADDDDDDDD